MGRCFSSIIASLLLVSSVWAQGTTTIRDGNGEGVADVINSTPSGTEYGIVVRPIGGVGGGGDGALLDGVSSSIKATVFDYTNSNPLGVVLRDTNGDYVSAGGGTQYNQGTATTDTDTLTMAGCVRADTAAVATGVADGDRARCILDSTGRIWVHVGTLDGGTITTITNPVAVTQSGTWNLNNISGTISLPTGAATAANQDGIIRDGTGDTTQANVSSGRLQVDGSGVTQPVSGTVTTTPPSNASTNVTQFGSNAVATGTGASGVGIPRVTISNDSSLAANQSVNVSQMGGTATSMNTGVRDAGTQRVTIATNDVVPASQSGTWTVQPGNTPNSAPWLTEPVKVSSANNDGACPSGSANTTALASNASRRVAYMAASSANTADIFIKLGATATSSDFRLAPGQAFNLGGGGSTYTGIVDFIPAAGTQALCVAELQ